LTFNHPHTSRDNSDQNTPFGVNKVEFIWETVVLVLYAASDTVR
jgi:hypothetical protein